MQLGSFLIVEPDEQAAGVLAQQCRRLRRAKVVLGQTEAVSYLEQKKRLTGLITEHDLKDGNGIDVVKRCRDLYPMLPVLMLTASIEPRVINRAHSLRAEFLAKPAHRKELRGFLRRAVAFERVPDQRIAWLVDEVVRTRGLSPRETDILAAAVEGTPRKQIAEQIGTTENTVKSCVKSVLRKCGAANLDEVVREIMRRALEGSAADTNEDIDRESIAPGPFTIRPPTTRNSD
jgi:two-component system response regulator DesR